MENDNFFLEESSSEHLEETVTLYHYTDETSKKGINSCGFIKPSNPATRRRLRHGQGVYLTAKSPRKHDQMSIAINNFRNGWLRKMREGRVKCIFEFVIPRCEVEKCFEGNRDVWVYKNGNLELSKYKTKQYMYKQP